MAIHVYHESKTIGLPRETDMKLSKLYSIARYAELFGMTRLYRVVAETHDSIVREWNSNALSSAKKQSHTNWLGGGVSVHVNEAQTVAEKKTSEIAMLGFDIWEEEADLSRSSRHLQDALSQWLSGTWGGLNQAEIKAAFEADKPQMQKVVSEYLRKHPNQGSSMFIGN